jgi:hypothetical protein
MSSRDNRKSREASRSTDTSNSRGASRSRDASSSRDVRKSRGARSSRDDSNSRDAWSSRDNRKSRDASRSRDANNGREASNSRDASSSWYYPSIQQIKSLWIKNVILKRQMDEEHNANRQTGTIIIGWLIAFPPVGEGGGAGGEVGEKPELYGENSVQTTHIALNREAPEKSLWFTKSDLDLMSSKTNKNIFYLAYLWPAQKGFVV